MLNLMAISTTWFGFFGRVMVISVRLGFRYKWATVKLYDGAGKAYCSPRLEMVISWVAW